MMREISISAEYSSRLAKSGGNLVRLNVSFQVDSPCRTKMRSTVSSQSSAAASAVEIFLDFHLPSLASSP